LYPETRSQFGNLLSALTLGDLFRHERHVMQFGSFGATIMEVHGLVVAGGGAWRHGDSTDCMVGGTMREGVWWNCMLEICAGRRCMGCFCQALNRAACGAPW